MTLTGKDAVEYLQTYGIDFRLDEVTREGVYKTAITHKDGVFHRCVFRQPMERFQNALSPWEDNEQVEFTRVYPSETAVTLYLEEP